MPKFCTIYTTPEDSGVDFRDSPSLTIQSAAENCDINNIMKRFNVTGILPKSAMQPQYLDLVSMQEKIENARALTERTQLIFDGLPSEIRQGEFGGEVSRFVAELGKSESLRQHFGLEKSPKADATPVETGVVNPTPSTSVDVTTPVTA